MADGSSIYGEYAWVENEEFFEDVDEPIKVIKETWVLQKSETIVFEPQWWDEDEYEEWYNDQDDKKLIRSKETDDIY